MRVTFLGTGTSQGVPVITCSCDVCNSIDFKDKRLRSSIYVEVDDLRLVIDTGPDFRQQMIRERIKKLDAVLFTHQHKDHTAGLDDIRSFNFSQRKDMPIYGSEEVLQQIKQEFSYAFSENKYPGVPQIQPIPITRNPFKIMDLNVIPIEVMHYKLPVFGYRIKDFTYITDAKTIGIKEAEKIRGTKFLVLNALQEDPHISHFTLDEAVEMAKNINAEKTYFTHMSHRIGLHQKINSTLPANIHLAYDGLMIEM